MPQLPLFRLGRPPRRRPAEGELGRRPCGGMSSAGMRVLILLMERFSAGVFVGIPPSQASYWLSLFFWPFRMSSVRKCI